MKKNTKKSTTKSTKHSSKFVAHPVIEKTGKATKPVAKAEKVAKKAKKVVSKMRREFALVEALKGAGAKGLSMAQLAAKSDTMYAQAKGKEGNLKQALHLVHCFMPILVHIGVAKKVGDGKYTAK